MFREDEVAHLSIGDLHPFLVASSNKLRFDAEAGGGRSCVVEDRFQAVDPDLPVVPSPVSRLAEIPLGNVAGRRPILSNGQEGPTPKQPGQGRDNRAAHDSLSPSIGR